MRSKDKVGFSKNLMPGPRAESTFILIFFVASLISYSRPINGPLHLSPLIWNHCLPQCVTELFQNPLYGHSPWSQEPGKDCPACCTKSSATITDSKQESGALECWESWAATNQGHDSELSVHPSKYPTADLQELHNLSLFVYESRRWQTYSSFLWLCQCGQSTEYYHTGSL